MKYNPNEELTDEQLKELSEDDFFEYLDSKAAYLKQFTQPLGQYHAKQFASQTKGSELTTILKCIEYAKDHPELTAHQIIKDMKKEHG